MADTSQTIFALSGFPPTLPNVPPLYQVNKGPGKIEMLLNANSNFLYHEFTPFTNYKSSTILGGILSDQQPFIYTYIDEAQKSTFNQLPDSVKGLADAAGLNQDSLNDVVRVSKFIASSWGAQFLLTQLAIQRLNPFDETRIYNPLSPILATVQPLTLGIGSPPLRHIEGGLLIGLANSITSTVGINLQSGYQKPKSTAGDATTLPSMNTTPGSSQGKGMIRGGDAAEGLLSLTSKWAPYGGTSQNQGLSSLFSSVANAFKTFFGNPPQSPGKFRADENASDLMYDSKFVYITKNGDNAYYSWFQPWYNKNTGTSPNNPVVKLYPNPQMSFHNIPGTLFQYQQIVKKSTKTILLNKGGTATVGYSPNTNGGTYTDSVHSVVSQIFTNSDILINFADYTDKGQKYTTKLSNPTDDNVISLNQQIQNVVQSINKSKTYNATSAVLSGLLPSGLINGGPLGYDRINTIKDNNNQNTGPNSTRQEYQYGSPNVVSQTIPRTIDETYKLSSGKSLRMATSFKSDGINLLGILPDNKSITANSTRDYTGWTTYDPYGDDSIAFFFYDVVNSKFIPFRATVKGISEGNTAFWDELRFIGRADQLYSYNGFSRTLAFTFNVVISSVSELLPTWKKINYIASSVKPSNYTSGKSTSNNIYDRFIVPPMFMITIGDLYKFQPMVITALNVNIPDDASWETLNQDNSPKGWSYLNGIITSPELNENYGQLPKEAEIAVTCNLLEKERANVGGSHFGHEPRVDNWETLSIPDRYLSTKDTFLPAPTTLHKNFVEWEDTDESFSQATGG